MSLASLLSWHELPGSNDRGEVLREKDFERRKQLVTEAEEFVNCHIGAGTVQERMQTKMLAEILAILAIQERNR